MTLRIQRWEKPEAVVYALIGRIQAEQVAELEELLRSDSSDHNVVLDLACVKLVNREAVQFLAECEASGIELRNCAGYIREWMTQEKTTKQKK
jgi:hypothetical protein